MLTTTENGFGQLSKLCTHSESRVRLREDRGRKLEFSLVSFNCLDILNLMSQALRVSQGFWGTREHWQNIEGNKGTLANFWEQGNKIRKITVRKHSENVWDHGKFWKGTTILEGNKDPPWETLCIALCYRMLFGVLPQITKIK